MCWIKIFFRFNYSSFWMAEVREGSDPRDPNQQTPEDDLSVPRAALNKMIKELLPNIRVANDARELILNCCTEFIHLISSEANEACAKQNKKTISPDHILNGSLRNNFCSEIQWKLHNSNCMGMN